MSSGAAPRRQPSARARALDKLWLYGRHGNGIMERKEATSLAEAIEEAVFLAEGALLGTEPRRDIWGDEDYLCAILACLTGDGDRARTAALANYARNPEAAS